MADSLSGRGSRDGVTRGSGDAPANETPSQGLGKGHHNTEYCQS